MVIANTLSVKSFTSSREATSSVSIEDLASVGRGSPRSKAAVTCCTTSATMDLPSCAEPRSSVLRTWSMRDRMRFEVVSTSDSNTPLAPQSDFNCSRMVLRRELLLSLPIVMAMSIAVVFSRLLSSSTSLVRVFCSAARRPPWLSSCLSISSLCDCIDLASPGISIASSSSSSSRSGDSMSSRPDGGTSMSSSLSDANTLLLK
mmetsp:Transcript_24087/g.53589  ORF Transcript_24087/g.53589 Transcript_24087/m.53589 type:complete len:203 (+) Transcript_24087:6335-6943(+)